MLERRLAALWIAAAATTLAPLAGASGWQEMHETSDDVRVEVGSDGIATIQHHLRYRVVAGHFKAFELVGIDPRAEILPEAVFTSEKGGAEILARVEAAAKTPGTVRVLIDDGRGLGRGAYVVDVRYRLDLVATKMLTRDGAMWKLAWTAPPAPEGHDGARVVFDLPAAPTEPRLAGAAESATTLSTLRRSAERDELELVRAHVPRGEAVTWAARVDPKAFASVSAPELRPSPAPDATPPSIIASNLSRIVLTGGFALLAGLLAALLREKQRAVRAACALRSASARPLLPLPWAVGPFVYGIAASLGLASLLWWSPTAGALLVVLAMMLASHRAPSPICRPRGPGKWRALPDARALLPERPTPLPIDALDISTTRARLALSLAVGVVLASASLLHPRVPQITIALPLASSALVPIFLTGTRAQLLPSPTELAARLLRPARDALASTIDLSHVHLVTIGRVVSREGTAHGTIDEVRLSCAPRDRAPGLRAIELALATCAGTRGALLEVFVRFDDGSAASDRIAAIAAGAPVVPGRTPEERVLRLVPDEPTPKAAATLVGKLLIALEARRVSDRPATAETRRRARWTGAERRGRGRVLVRTVAPGALAT